PAPLREEAKAAAAAAAPGSEEQKAARAVVYVTSPLNLSKLRKRFATPVARDPAPQDRARLLAALAAVQAAGYQVPTLEGAQASPAPAPQTTAQRTERVTVEYIDEDEEDLDLEDLLEAEDALWLDEVQGLAVAGCPGTCAVRS
ncbi:MAG TPA: hypothetical protein VLS89_18525, partial [Candidatus Nanopelagicales bacterium]|nr:hypothetical protein [Candidatus Nanopelagicales bacterium]